jgi:HAD superfamily hydrolase (TIGR01509 family)
MATRTRAVFFDFGGTLFSYSALAHSGFRNLVTEAVERLGATASLKDAGRAYGKASAESMRDFNPKPYYLHRDMFVDGYRRFARAIGHEAGEEFLDWFYERQRTMFFDGCVLRPGCLETLRSMRQGGLHVAIVSNIDDDYLLPMMQKVGLDRVLDGWTSSEEARSCKPDGAIFEYAMKKAGVSAAESYFVGDSPVHDVAGAQRVGMRAVLLQEPGVQAPGTRSGEGGEADHVIEELPELLPIVLPAP